MIKKSLKRLLNYFRIEIKRKPSTFVIEERKIQKYFSENRWLVDLNLQTLIDIGANEGQFAHKIRNILPNVMILSFEPIPKVYETLVKSFKNDTLFTSYNIALGESAKNAKMWLNEYSPSSSLLEMQEHLDQFSHAREQISIDVNIDTLDKVLREKEIKKPYLVKIDVQGYEENVIKGGISIISKAKIVIIEVSFRQLYESHTLFDGIYRYLYDLGFRYHGNYEQLYSPINHEVLQADAIFLKY